MNKIELIVCHVLDMVPEIPDGKDGIMVYTWHNNMLVTNLQYTEYTREKGWGLCNEKPGPAWAPPCPVYAWAYNPQTTDKRPMKAIKMIKITPIEYKKTQPKSRDGKEVAVWKEQELDHFTLLHVNDKYPIKGSDAIVYWADIKWRV